MQSEVSYTGVPTRVNSQEFPILEESKSCSNCKITLIVLGIIFIFGGTASSLGLYFLTELGNYSFCCLTAVPLGIGVLVSGILYDSASLPKDRAEDKIVEPTEDRTENNPQPIARTNIVDEPPKTELRGSTTYEIPPSPPIVWVDEDPHLTVEKKLEKLHEALKENEVYFTTNFFLDTIKFCPPSQNIPYAFFTVPLQVGNFFFHVDLWSVSTARDPSKEQFNFSYQGVEFDSLGKANWGIYGDDTTPTWLAFKNASAAWEKSFKEWNIDENGNQKYLTWTNNYDIINRLRIAECGAVELHCAQVELIKKQKNHYYVPDYESHKMSPDKKFLRIHRKHPSPLIKVSCFDYLPDKMRKKIFSQACVIALPGSQASIEVSYDNATKMLTLTKSQNP